MSKRAFPDQAHVKSSKAKTAPNQTKQVDRRNKLFNSRQIRTSNNDPSFKEGILDIPSFLKNREYEIQQLEQAQLRSKYSAATRVFQSLPRTLRRRTASHNVKRLPKRMRKRAVREMKANQLANNETAKKKYRVKGKELFDLKRTKKLLRIASRLKSSKIGIFNDDKSSIVDYNLKNKIKHITNKIHEIEKQKAASSINAARSKEEVALIESKLKLNNRMGSYDNLGINHLAPKPRGEAKYNKRQKNFVWLPTHVWHTKRAHMIKRWGYQIPLAPTQKCYRSAHRKFQIEGGLIGDTSYMGTIILESKDKAGLKSLLMEITDNKHRTRANKVWTGFIYMKNLEDQINKIVGKSSILYAIGESSSKAMLRIHPSIFEEYFNYLLTVVHGGEITVTDCRYAIGSINFLGPMSLTALTRVLLPTQSPTNTEANKTIMQLGSLQDLNSISTGTIMSLFSDDPRLVSSPIKQNPNKLKGDPIDLIIGVNQGEAVNKESVDAILSFQGRLKSYENQPTIKELSSRRGKADPGINLLPKTDTDPSIPILIYKNEDIGYTMLLPWYWVLPFWIKLNRIPHLSIMGLKQMQQLNYESGKLAYPNDYPWLTAGAIENFLQGNEASKKWNRIQKGKKINYDKLDLRNNDELFGTGEVGSPFNCDWQFLKLLRFGLAKMQKKLSGTSGSTQKFEVSNWNDKTLERELITFNDVYEHIGDIKADQKKKLEEGQLFLDRSIALYTDQSASSDCLKVTPINITLVNRGHPKNHARIYSVPEGELSKWLNKSKSRKATGKSSYQTTLTTIQCPHANHLIGFITSGTFNLAKGCGTAIGYVDADFAKEKYVIIRNVGESIPRLGHIQPIHDL